MGGRHSSSLGLYRRYPRLFLRLCTCKCPPEHCQYPRILYFLFFCRLNGPAPHFKCRREPQHAKYSQRGSGKRWRVPVTATCPTIRLPTACQQKKAVCFLACRLSTAGQDSVIIGFATRAPVRQSFVEILSNEHFSKQPQVHTGVRLLHQYTRRRGDIHQYTGKRGGIHRYTRKCGG